MSGEFDREEAERLAGENACACSQQLRAAIERIGELEAHLAEALDNWEDWEDTGHGSDSERRASRIVAMRSALAKGGGR